MLELTAGWTGGLVVESNTQKDKLTLQTKPTQTHKYIQVTLTHTSVVPSQVGGCATKKADGESTLRGRESRRGGHFCIGVKGLTTIPCFFRV